MNRSATIAIFILVLVFTVFRFQYKAQNQIVTTWDAFGYYMYLPSAFIYHDAKELAWVDSMDQKYKLTGGVFYQATRLPSGTYTNKYLCGVAIMQAPFFLLAHIAAPILGEAQDGFSPIYQKAIIWGALFWLFLGLLFLRKSLLCFFEEKVVAITLLLLGLCSNLIQYSTIDAAQSHVWIFSLYCFMLWLTILWHKKPKASTAFFIGLLCGLATIARPTELIMLFIPLLWGLDNAKAKWALVAKHQNQVLVCILGGVIGLLPQLLYWYYTTGSLIYDVGSKWFFLNPWWRVLVGPEKGWFLYMPISLVMVFGLWKMKAFPFQKSVIVFCLLNFWIIMAWSDWRYGGSYATRALVQSYPVLCFALASFVAAYYRPQRNLLWFGMAILLVILNFYQLHLYNHGAAESFSPLLLWK